MDWNRVEGNWKQLKGRAKQQWGKLTDDDLTVAAGRRDELAGRVQERYGIARRGRDQKCRRERGDSMLRVRVAAAAVFEVACDG